MVRAIVILACNDVEAMCAFYRRVLGWRQVVDEEVFKQLRSDFGMDLGLYSRAGYASNIGGRTPQALAASALSSTELYFIVEDLTAACALANQAGAELLAEATAKPWGDSVTYYRDPEGNVLALAQNSED
ncbi:MAG: VOC family protein [Planctomycetes bacterium]|nr:VOC family protein [Planctomycetota bacterium]